MSVLRYARWLAGGTTLTIGVAVAAAATGPAALGQALGIVPVINRHAAVSWGVNFLGQLPVSVADALNLAGVEYNTLDEVDQAVAAAAAIAAGSTGQLRPRA